ncbi:MAG: alpha/beta fold hydrolase, partial [Brachybacterium sp.]|nr:alpha/beta fold hydrolase [Brachybacterium sp.]
MRAAEISGAVLCVVTCAEQLVNSRNHERGGLNDWRLLRYGGGPTQQRLAPLLDRLFSPVGVQALLLARIATAGVQLVPGVPGRLRGAANLTNASLTHVMSFLHNNGGDGSDQVGFLVPAVTGGGRVVGSERAVDASLWTLSLQGAMSYAIAGWVKLFGDTWRDGGALEGVLRTRTFGSEPVWQVVDRHPALGRVMERATLILECGFPLIFFVRRPWQRMIVAGIMSMHVSIAFIMGLGRFVPAFGSFQAPLLYVTLSRSELPARRFEDVPRLAGAVAAATVAGSILYRRRLEAAIRDNPQQSLPVRDLDLQVAYRHRTAEPGQPTLVGFTGLMSSKETWYPLIEELPPGWGWIIFDRPGYDGLELRGHTSLSDPTLHLSVVETLLDELVGPDDDVWVVGHSLGGLLAMDPRYNPVRRFTGQILLDPSVYRST